MDYTQPALDIHQGIWVDVQAHDLARDRFALLKENERLWRELEQTKVALAVETTLRRNMLASTSGNRPASVKYDSQYVHCALLSIFTLPDRFSNNCTCHTLFSLTCSVSFCLL